MHNDELVRLGEVAEIFRVDPKPGARWARNGRLDTIRTPGGHRRFRPFGRSCRNCTAGPAPTRPGNRQ